MAIRKIVLVYKDLIQGNVTEMPPYALEPPDEIPSKNSHDTDGSRASRLRNDSYLGAIHKENLLVRAGSQVVVLLVSLTLGDMGCLAESLSTFYDTCCQCVFT